MTPGSATPARAADRSPYERALGARMAQLHPALQQYFATIPAGSVGIGDGVFTTAGSRRRWLRPFFRLAERQGVAFAGWATDVPFRIRNRTVDGQAIAERDFHLPGRTWIMRDVVSLTPAGVLRDELGGGAVVASFDADVRDGVLRLTSRRIGLRFGRLRMRVPRAVAPTIRLVERYGGADDRQHVDLTIDLPLVGRVYEYRGTFTYRIESETR